MPSDEHQTSPQADRLNRKIERLQTGQPSPVHDGDTEELAALAQLLMEQLDKELPDPDFREQLQKDLTEPGPRLVKLQPRSGPRRYPVPALFGALTVVLVASAVTGWMAFADAGGASGSPMNRVARFASASPTATTGALVAAGTATAFDTSRNSTPNPESQAGAVGEDGQMIVPRATASPDDAQQHADQAPSESEQRAVVDLPPVDDRTVELGALATVTSASEVDTADIRFSQAVDPETVELDSEGLAYEFSAPYVDANLMLRGVQEFLGIEAQIEPRERAGRTVYALSSPGGSVNFTWSPESGAFSCTLPDPYSTSEIEDLSEAAIQWLEEFGFPVGDGNVRPVIQTNEDGQRFVHVPLGDRNLPDPAVGHPMSITLVVDDAGRIVSVSGYWLEVMSEDVVPLVSAATAWQIVSSGGGYWPQGTGPDRPGEFVAERFELSYMLTSAEQPNKGLVLQPVVAISGTFHPDDGDPSQTTVYVQGLASL